METLTGSWFAAALLLSVFSSVRAQNRETYVAVGGDLELMPPEDFKELSNILWKFNNNLVAEWVKDIINLQYYGRFKGRTTMDTTNGRLVITKMTAADTGLYTVETNNRVQVVGYNAKVINKVSKPVVEIRPLACSSASTDCTLTCEGDTTGTGPVTYSWKRGDKDWTESEKLITIINTEELQSVTTFSCRMKNPVNAEESDPVSNPFFQEKKNDESWVIGVIFGVLLLAVGGGVGVGLWKRQEIMKLYRNLTGNRGEASSRQGGDSEEGTSLNGKESNKASSSR